MDTYKDFIEAKILSSPTSGFQLDKALLNDSLFPHQCDTVSWAVAQGSAAIFAKFGLGKTRIQLEIARQFILQKAGLALFIVPLGVRQEFFSEGLVMGMPLAYVRNDAEIAEYHEETRYLITNYERVRDGHITDFSLFTVVCLDEASVLRSYGSKTYQTFLEILCVIPHRFVLTATPAPNRFKEIIHYAGFLGVMDTGQALTRFFQRNSQKANELTLYPHKEREFWLWVSTWALFLSKPSDLGYDDTGYDLPKLKLHFHCISTSGLDAGYDSWGQGKLFRDQAMGLKDAAREKRLTLLNRVAKAVEIIETDKPDSHWLLWHHLEDERRALEQVAHDRDWWGFNSVYGSQELDEREELIIGFGNGDYSILATKPEIAGSGCNFQRHCHKNIFLGINYQFNDFIQAIHRTLRYQQQHDVDVHIIYADTEEPILKELMRKWEQHDVMSATLQNIVKSYGLTQNAMNTELRRSLGVERREVRGERFTAVYNDSVDEAARMVENSVDMILTSIPFSNHYEYTPAYEDFGHTQDDEHFFAQMDFLIPNLLRITKPGRIAAIHVKDRILYGNVTGLGMPSVNPFSDKTVAAFTKHGWIYTGRICVVTDVVRENNQTYRLGWSEVCKDGSKMGCGQNEYILLFRKLPTDTSKSYADEPVVKDKANYPRRQWQIDASGFWRSSGNRLLSPDEIGQKEIDSILTWYRTYNLETVYDYQQHVDLGRSLEENGRMPATFMLFAPGSHDENVWTDIIRMQTLNSRQSQKREQNHVCPLQLDLIYRLINRFTNEDELVYDPFGGLCSVSFQAIKMNRRGYSSELNPDYFEAGVGYCREAEYKRTVPTLFDLIEAETFA